MVQGVIEQKEVQSLDMESGGCNAFLNCYASALASKENGRRNHAAAGLERQSVSPYCF